MGDKKGSTLDKIIILLEHRSLFTALSEKDMNFSMQEHRDKLSIENIDKLTVDCFTTKENSKHGSLLPNSVRCIVSGPSNSGKTNIVFNLLTHENGLRFNNVYIFSKSLNQPKYQLLEKILADVKEINYFKFNENDHLMEMKEVKPYSVFVFDDIACENHDKVKAYFMMGRHHNIDSIYIGQTYSRIPKQLIRDNVNLLVLFKQDDTNLKHVYSDHVGADMSFLNFKELCGKAWSDRFGSLVINKDQPLSQGRYSIGFDRFFVLN